MTIGLVILGTLDRRSGGYSYDVDLVRALETLGHRVEVWSLPTERTEACRALGSRFDAATCSTLILDALVHDLVLEELEVRRAATRSRWIALVHHLAWLEDGFPGPQAATKKARELRFLNLMNGFVFNSNNTRDTVVDLRGPAASFLPSVICRPPQAPVKYRPPAASHQGRFLFLGNLVPRKNLHSLLDALAHVAQNRPELEWSLTVAGSPDLDQSYAEACRRRAETSPGGERIVWRGRVSDAERERLWAETDLLTLPSFHEGWGMAHAEALARGLPSLAVPRGGVLEVLGDAALWSEPDSASLAQALENYLSKPELRQQLSGLARHRAPVWVSNTGFEALGPFLEMGAADDAPNDREAFSWSAYLEAKASIDSKSLHPRVREAAFSGGPPGTVVELGGGTGTMARRLRDAGLVGSDTRYLLVDQDRTLLETAAQKVSSLFGPGLFLTQEADLRQYWADFAGPGPDLVIAHALLDLFDPRAAAPALAAMGAGRYWLTHLFDGLTAWEPVLDPSLDEALARAYHGTMEARAPGGAQGSPRSGRDWLEALPRAGLRVVDAGSSDWIVRPVDGKYSPSEHTFLHSMLHFFRSSLTGRSDVDQDALAWWLAARTAQVRRGAATLIVHQLDLLAEPVPKD